MPNVSKKIQKWRNSKQEVRREEIESVLEHYFPGMWSFGSKTGSHVYKITHPKLKGVPGYGVDGDFSIPTTGGQRIKHWYLKKLIQAIDIVSEE